MQRPDIPPAPTPGAPGGPARLVARMVTAWALFGGVVLGLVVAVNVADVAGSLAGWPLWGVVELTELGAAIAIFAFLPWCQLTGANVAADIFTTRAGPRFLGVLGCIAAIVAVTFMVLLAWRMTLGMVDQRDFGHSTAILGLPVWPAFVPALVSLVLTGLAGLVTLADSLRAARAA